MTIHEILDAGGEAQRIAKGGRRRRWIRRECSRSNMMRHADFKQLADGRWFIGCEDGASRYLGAIKPARETSPLHSGFQARQPDSNNAAVLDRLKTAKSTNFRQTACDGVSQLPCR